MNSSPTGKWVHPNAKTWKCKILFISGSFTVRLVTEIGGNEIFGNALALYFKLQS